MINLIKLQCPNCSANLEVDASLKQCFCQYCGTKILLHNENEQTVNINQTSRFVDEAELAKQENERKKIEFEQKKYADKKAKESAPAEPTWPIPVAVFLGFGSLVPAVAGISSLTTGGFLSFLVGVLALITLAAVWYGYYVLLGKTLLKPKIGLIIMFVSAILCILFTRFVYQLFPAS